MYNPIEINSKLIELVRQNPDLPTLAWVNYEVCVDDSYSCWLGEIWDYEQNKFIKNPCFMNCGVLYLQYELNPQYEITPKIIASISGVPTSTILNGKYSNDEESRVDHAIEILNASQFYIVTMPSFTVGLLETYCKDYVYNHNVQYICFDYLSSTAAASSDIAKNNGVTTRSDEVLSAISSKLKDIAVELNVAMLSFTQVNAQAYSQEVLDSSVIAGSRAVLIS